MIIIAYLSNNYDGIAKIIQIPAGNCCFLKYINILIERSLAMSIELKKFSINKLYGYKDIHLIFNEKSTIIIAENGAGKTTLINALKSTLKGERLC